ncbi:PREDICTED: TCDD-inducible poly [ADP-ribose] polymerase-like [Nicrophorus vespilloides]|uniref:Poly [ADP-ribose] polymerase n=1 Tax=Nicrophorus vespilloides TaxID=110193 RepID=A0ABM1MIB1_NICVS|nr:PREDICTED: TCDD-inducible poly [ADP-ribose] polymerase-like [Nicrophorus vespilloides]
MEVERNNDIIEYLQQNFGYKIPKFCETTNKVYTLSKLDESGSEYKSIAKTAYVYGGTIGEISIISIEKVFNPYTLALYNLKKSETNGDVLEYELWHGTTESSLDNILKKNFDYRLVKQHLFGKGISFSKYFSYAFHYSVSNNPQIDEEYCILLCNVFIGKTEIGYKGTNYPNPGYNTTIKSNGDVFVKYDDDTFYPTYKIRYTIKEKS